MIFRQIIDKVAAMSNCISQNPVIVQVRVMVGIKITILITARIKKKKQKTKQN